MEWPQGACFDERVWIFKRSASLLHAQTEIGSGLHMQKVSDDHSLARAQGLSLLAMEPKHTNSNQVWAMYLLSTQKGNGLVPLACGLDIYSRKTLPCVMSNGLPENINSALRVCLKTYHPASPGLGLSFSDVGYSRRVRFVACFPLLAAFIA